MTRLTTCVLVAALIAAPAAFAQDEGSPFGFQASINLGTDVIPDPSVPGQSTSWTRLGFQPDLSFGNWGLGIDLSFRFRLYPEPDQAIEFYPGDWVPDYKDNGKTVFDLYLPKLMYLRYGQKGDPLYAKFGSIGDLTLGDGFIVGNYSNMRFMPEQRIFGLETGLDGVLIGAPVFGIELLTGNLAQFDVAGGRVFVRPLVSSGIPIVEAMQVGLTVAADTKPYLYYEDNLTDPLDDKPANAPSSVLVYGADVFVPILASDAVSLAAFTDFVMQPEGRWGYMAGTGGKLMGLFTYGAQFRFLGPEFIPVYFDANYDLFRAIKANAMASSPSGDPFAGWFATLGTELLEGKIILKAGLDGSFSGIPDVDTANPAEYPHLRGVFSLGEGLVGGFSFDATWEKYFLGRADGFWADMIDPEDAVITAAVNYRTGAALITLLYNLKYNPAASNGFDITSSLTSSIKF